MALMHQATITPTKQELLRTWLPTQSWYDGASDRDPVAAFRLDDPAGEVGIECFVLGNPAGGGLFVPVTYRPAPLDGVAEIVVMEHSVLGRRWVYDATLDPVSVSVLAATILTGGTQAVEEVQSADGTRTVRDPQATAQGSGSAEVGPSVAKVSAYDEGATTVVHAEGFELVVLRDLTAPIEAAETLEVTWPGGTVTVAGVR